MSPAQRILATTGAIDARDRDAVLSEAADLLAKLRDTKESVDCVTLAAALVCLSEQIADSSREEQDTEGKIAIEELKAVYCARSRDRVPMATVGKFFREKS